MEIGREIGRGDECAQGGVETFLFVSRDEGCIYAWEGLVYVICVVDKLCIGSD